jgi:hypothetical protein
MASDQQSDLLAYLGSQQLGVLGTLTGSGNNRGA